MAKDKELDRLCAEIARLLVLRRKELGLSMNQLATKSGLSQSRISMFEASPGNPTIKTLLRIAGALDVDLGEIVSSAKSKLRTP